MIIVNKSKNPAAEPGSFSLEERSIVVVMTVFLNDHDLGIVIAPSIVMTARPTTMKTTIVMSVFRNNYCSILRVCGYGWQRNCDRA